MGIIINELPLCPLINNESSLENNYDDNDEVHSTFDDSDADKNYETFATLNKNSSKKSYCVLWHEALSGRKAEALVDSILRVISEERDVSEFIFWADNCTGQNKNWVLYTALITEVNRPTGPKEIRIKYLTKGDTHMSADGIHGNIEQKLGRKRNVYDFQELVEVIENCRKNVNVLKLNQFHSWKNKKRAVTKKVDDPLKGFTLNPLVEVKFNSGCRFMKYETDFDEEYKEIDFLQKKTYYTTPSRINKYTWS
ncbi:hypothetical protein NQ314_009197 [Rhamnusium bicolor]|uniref:DUF7869 domain-containing protein n=1 Tax=Rhamnusium bicolor TaxID=1586634 RepID=A0AAV8Y3Q1_9CUCU|nr:hypothetical protein NQ314_009197 [Rhamnusium bicolor]